MGKGNKALAGMQGKEAQPAALPKQSAQQLADERRFRAEDDMRILTRANEISCDRDRLSAVKEHAKAQMKSLAAIAGSPRSAKPSGKRR